MSQEQTPIQRRKRDLECCLANIGKAVEYLSEVTK